jgi:hypothetical protein
MLTIKNVGAINRMLCYGKSIEKVSIIDDYYIFHYPIDGYEKYSSSDTLQILLSRNALMGSYYLWVYGFRFETETMCITENLKRPDAFVTEIKRLLAKLK